jgi:hypothetical protein
MTLGPPECPVPTASCAVGIDAKLLEHDGVYFTSDLEGPRLAAVDNDAGAGDPARPRAAEKSDDVAHLL